MATYYIVENNQQAGPFTLDQLAAKGITPETNVWTDGMSNWTPASQVSELQSLFAPQPQYAPQPQQYTPQPEPEPQVSAYQSSESSYSSDNQEFNTPLKDWKMESIILTVISVLCCCGGGFFTYGIASCFNIIGLVFGILGILEGNKVSQFQNTNYELAKQASEKAGKWVKIGGIIMIVVNIFALVAIGILIAVGVAGNMLQSLS